MPGHLIAEMLREKGVTNYGGREGGAQAQVGSFGQAGQGGAFDPDNVNYQEDMTLDQFREFIDPRVMLPRFEGLQTNKERIAFA